MGYAISVHERDTARRLETRFSLIYSHVPKASIALQKELYFLSSIKHPIMYLFHKSSYHPYKENRGHIFISHPRTDRLMEALQIRGGKPSVISNRPGFAPSFTLTNHEALSKFKFLHSRLKYLASI